MSQYATFVIDSATLSDISSTNAVGKLHYVVDGSRASYPNPNTGFVFVIYGAPANVYLWDPTNTSASIGTAVISAGTAAVPGTGFISINTTSIKHGPVYITTTAAFPGVPNYTADVYSDPLETHTATRIKFCSFC